MLHIHFLSSGVDTMDPSDECRVQLIATTSPHIPGQTTTTGEQLIAYIARVSNPKNQDNHETADRLLRYCIRNQHWSPFEHVSMTVDIKTSRAIAAQLLRHRSFVFQEFSQRYAEPSAFAQIEARREHPKNRQSSVDDMSDSDRQWFHNAQAYVNGEAMQQYRQAIKRGVAREQARFLLPLSVETRLFMTGSVRSWIHYIQLRCADDVQQEHRDIALEVRRVFVQQFPAVAAALEWV